MSPHYLQLPYNPAETYVSNQKLASIMDDLNMSEYVSAYLLGKCSSTTSRSILKQLYCSTGSKLEIS